MVNVRVKWKAQKFDVAVEPAEGLDAFKAQLLSLTNVPVEKMKVMVRGRLLKTDAAVTKLKEGQMVMLIGTASALQQAPQEPVRFREDMTAEEQVHAGAATPAGLRNLGNTCYLNSTMQCLRNVPPLKEALVQHSQTAGDLPAAVGRTMQQMDAAGDDTVTPVALVQSLQQAVPRFAESQRGVPMQQDAEECLTELLQRMQAVGGGDLVHQVFGGEMTQTTRPADEALAEVEPEESTRSTFSKLRCHIDQSVNQLSTGLKAALTDEVDKRSSVTGNTTTYRRESRLASLPPHLLVQLVRFYWRRDIQKKTKVLRRVKFPLQLDVTDLCDDSLQQRVREYRRKCADLEEAAREAANVMSDQPDDEAHALKLEAETALQTLLDSGAAESGTYELHGVLTHKGESANSGHYIGWTKSPAGQWHKFDDDKVTAVNDDEILKLAGGGQWDMAYMLFFRKVPAAKPQLPQ